MTVRVVIIPEPDTMYLDDCSSHFNLNHTEVYDHILFSDIGDIHRKKNNTQLIISVNLNEGMHG